MSFDDINSCELLEQYLEICNSAIDANRDRFPFKQIFSVLSDPDNTRMVAAYIKEPAAIRPVYIEVQGHDFSVKEAAKKLPQKVWRVHRSYLEEVIEAPLSYINNPAKIDWDWIYEG